MNNEQQNKVNIINNLLDSNVDNNIVQVTFRKKDNSIRNMLLKKSPELEATVKGTRAEATQRRKWTLSESGMKCVEELKPDMTYQFRTLNLLKVTQLTVNGTVHQFEEL